MPLKWSNTYNICHIVIILTCNNVAVGCCTEMCTLQHGGIRKERITFVDCIRSNIYHSIRGLTFRFFLQSAEYIVCLCKKDLPAFYVSYIYLKIQH